MYVNVATGVMHNCIDDYDRPFDNGGDCTIANNMHYPGIPVDRHTCDLRNYSFQEKRKKERIRLKRVACKYVARSLWRAI